MDCVVWRTEIFTLFPIWESSHNMLFKGIGLLRNESVVALPGKWYRLRV